METLLNLSEKFAEFENRVYFWGNSVGNWLLALALTVVIYFAFRFIFSFVVERINKFFYKRNIFIGTVTDALKNSKLWFFAIIAVFFGTRNLNFGGYQFLPFKILILAAFVQIGIWLNVIFGDVLDNWWKKKHPQNTPKNVGYTIISWFGRFVIYSIILLLILDNLGVKIVSLMAGLGVGGIAIALAVQKILGDLFASISIMADKPFEIGDFIAIGDVRGTVESIGIKTTRIRSVNGEQIVISNGDILESRLNNFKRMSERRITFKFGVSYKTAKENLQTITALVKNIIESQGNTRFERGHLVSFDASSMNYEFIYWVTNPDYVAHMDIQEKINLAIIYAFAEKNIEMSRPTQAIFLQTSPNPIPQTQ